MQHAQNATGAEQLRRELHELSSEFDSVSRRAQEDTVTAHSRLELLRLALANAHSQLSTVMQQVSGVHFL